MPEIIELPYCPRCGNRSFKSGAFKPWLCQSCDFKLYPNVATAAGVFIFDEHSQVLFNERAHNPGKGKLGLPGGFLDPGETAEAAVIREIDEEVGLLVKDLTYLGSFPNQYFYGGILYDTLDMFFTAEAVTKKVTLDPAEVSSVQWRKPDSVSQEELAFPSYVQALKALLKKMET
jgi:NADH pyrophosphatase NudC (nudix superfamily)